MTIDDYAILVAKGPWVDEDLLYSRELLDQIVDRLGHLAKYPDYQAYLINAPVNRFKRIRLGHYRVFVRLHQDLHIMAILACERDRAIKRNEVAGSLKYEFIEYLLTHERFDVDRYVAFAPPVEAPVEVAPVVQPEPELPIQWGWTCSGPALSEQEAEDILLELAGAPPSDPFCLDVLSRVERALPGDRVIVPLPTVFGFLVRDQIKELQRSITKTLAYHRKRYSVRFDDLSHKFLLVPPDKIDVYCSDVRGRRSQGMAA